MAISNAGASQFTDIRNIGTVPPFIGDATDYGQETLSAHVQIQPPRP